MYHLKKEDFYLLSLISWFCTFYSHYHYLHYSVEMMKKSEIWLRGLVPILYKHRCIALVGLTLEVFAGDIMDGNCGSIEWPGKASAWWPSTWRPLWSWSSLWGCCCYSVPSSCRTCFIYYKISDEFLNLSVCACAIFFSCSSFHIMSLCMFLKHVHVWKSFLDKEVPNGRRN